MIMVIVMTRTEKLFTILMLLLISFSTYLFFEKKEEVTNVIKSFIYKFKEREAIPPYDKTVNHNQYTFLSVSETDNFKPYSIQDIKDIYYTVLNNGWEEFTFYCPKDYDTCPDDVRLVANDNSYITQINNYVSPYNSYQKYNTTITNDQEVYLKIEKLYDNNDIFKVNNKIKEIFNYLGIDINDDIQINIKKIHDYIISNTTYDDSYVTNEETISNKATGTLFNNIALCSGYADTFAIMLDKLNIPNFRISNDEHIWNVVYINNRWMHIDITWDDDEINKNNYYNFYLLSTDELLKKDNTIHTFDRDLYKETK